MNNIILTDKELKEIYNALDLHWYAFTCTDSDDEWYEVKVGSRVFDINIYESEGFDNFGSADLYECFMDNDSWKTNVEKEYALFKHRAYIDGGLLDE
jgi:hypothetical protein